MCYHRTFREPRKGFVAHTAASRSIVEKAGIRDTLGVMFDEGWQSYARVCDELNQQASFALGSSFCRLAHRSSSDSRSDGEIQKPRDE